MKFIKKHLILVVILSIVLAVLLTLIILIFTLFSLRSVDLNFKTETSILSGEEIQQEIIDDVFEHRGSVLFINKKRIIDQLEKNFPYLKVVNIETIFPSKFVVHCVEREELYAVISNGKTYILDEDMKILKINNGGHIKTEDNAVLLDLIGLELNLTNAEKGQFLNIGYAGEEIGDILANNSQTVLTSLLTAFESSNYDISYIRAQFNNFNIKLTYQEVGENRTWYVVLSLVNNLGFETVIIEANNRLPEKIGVMLTSIGDISVNQPEKLLTHKLVVYENDAGEIEVAIQLK
jgi:hypothetical protein